jgi:signal transduction histidine kinase
MKNQNQEILAIIILGALLALLLVGFIVGMLFLYQKRQNEYKKEMATMQEEYDQQILRVQFEMQEATLKEIADKLHDGLKNNIVSIIQRLHLIGFHLSKNSQNVADYATQIEQITTDLTNVKDEVRLTSHSLSPDRITQVGLIDAIRFEAKRLAQISHLKVIFDVDETKEYFIGETNSVYLFRMSQEIIGNVLTHSKATQINIHISLLVGNIFALEIKDNGIGFNINDKKKNKNVGMGLAGMQKRSLQIGADIIVTSSPNVGTSITIKLPLPQVENIKANDNKEKQTKYSFD